MSTKKISTEPEATEHTHDEQEAHVHGPNCNHGHDALRPITRVTVKIGRNDPCTCGSKKKYKKCCGA
jgi:uncharacterized protein YecA (UPF0149 family)